MKLPLTLGAEKAYSWKDFIETKLEVSDSTLACSNTSKAAKVV